MRKTYWAVVAKREPEEGQLVADLPEQGTIDLPVLPGGAFRPAVGGEWLGAPAAGRAAAGALPAVTKFTLRAQNKELGWLELRPQTGRK